MAKCIFCNNNKVSKEHLWGAWWKDYYPPSEQDLLARNNHTITIRDANGNLKEKKGQFSNVGDVFATTTKVACENCNNTWMSQIEEKMKKAFHSLFIEKTEIINKDFSISIKKWMYLKYCLIDRAYSDLTTIVQSDRVKEVINVTRSERWQMFQKNKVIPNQFQFFIARSTRDNKIGAFNHIPLIKVDVGIHLIETCLFLNGDFIGLITNDEKVVKYFDTNDKFTGLRQLVDINTEKLSINDVISGRELEDDVLLKLEERAGSTLRRSFT